MSAREELHESLCGSCCGRFALGECEAVNLQIDAFAHELADKIRKEFEEAFEANQEVLSGTDAMSAADLIDPDVTP